MKPHKIYYYISMWTNGNMAAGYRIERDTNLERLGKKWLGERSCDVTPIMEGMSSNDRHRSRIRLLRCGADFPLS